MLKVITLPFDEGTGGFDDSALQHALRHRVLLGHEEHFFVHQGRPY